MNTSAFLGDPTLCPPPVTDWDYPAESNRIEPASLVDPIIAMSKRMAIKNATKTVPVLTKAKEQVESESFVRPARLPEWQTTWQEDNLPGSDRLTKDERAELVEWGIDGIAERYTRRVRTQKGLGPFFGRQDFDAPSPGWLFGNHAAMIHGETGLRYPINWQYRPDNPLFGDDKSDGREGSLKKYLFQKGVGAPIVVLPEMQERVGQVPIVAIVEGTKQMRATAKHCGDDTLVLGITGAWNYSWQGGANPVLMRLVPLNSKKVVLIFDADIRTNYRVWSAAERLRKHIISLGISTRRVRFGEAN